MKLLHIDSSALGAYSVSRELTAAIVTELRRLHPQATVTYHDLAAEALSHWAPTGDGADAAARENNALLEEFLAADTVVIGAPMYNFGISSQLKAWIDRILIAGKTFQYGANGPEGLAGGKRVIVVSTRGGYYGEGTPGAAFEHNESYLRVVLGFIGLTNVEFVRAEGLAMGPEVKAAAVKAAHEGVNGLLAA